MPTSRGPGGRSATPPTSTPSPDTAAADPSVWTGPRRPPLHGSAGADRVVSSVYHRDADFPRRRALRRTSTRPSTASKTGVDRGVIGDPRNGHRVATFRRNLRNHRLLHRLHRIGLSSRRSRVRVPPLPPFIPHANPHWGVVYGVSRFRALTRAGRRERSVPAHVLVRTRHPPRSTPDPRPFDAGSRNGPVTPCSSTS